MSAASKSKQELAANQRSKAAPADKSPPVPNSRKKVLLVDDHPMLRGGLAQIINQQPDLLVCGEAADAAEAMRLVESAKPGLAVVDLSLAGKSGLELIKDLRALHPELPVLVMSMHDETIYAERILRAGARGYAMKTAGGETLLQAIRHVLAGKIYLSQRMSAQILEHFSGPRPVKHNSPIEMLTDREFEVFQLIGQGCVTREIARRLNLSPKTVDVYRQHLKEKFNLPSATGLIQQAVRWTETQKQA